MCHFGAYVLRRKEGSHFAQFSRNRPFHSLLYSIFRILQRDFTKKTNEFLHFDKMVVFLPKAPSFCFQNIILLTFPAKQRVFA